MARRTDLSTPPSPLALSARLLARRLLATHPLRLLGRLLGRLAARPRRPARCPGLCAAERRRGVAAALLGGVGLVLALSLARAVVQPSYQHPPAHYGALRAAVEASTAPGRGNPHGETVFIAANIVREDLIRGAWGAAVLELIALLGPANVFLSVYENDSGPGTVAALEELARKAPCNASIVAGDHLPLSAFPPVTLPSGARHVKRVAYLAEVRNRALRPLDAGYAPPAGAAPGFRHAPAGYDRILFLNDVYFRPLDALHLLFSTHRSPATGRAAYRAACGLDFHRYAMFYDTFATRDLDGFENGYMVFPWFAPAGRAASRNDVLAGSDAVRVSSCWSGIAAFDAAPFQAAVAPLRFRHEPELFIEASECCLIHADLAAGVDAAADDKGIYVNPYVRVAYKPAGFAWLPLLTRFERFFIPIQYLFSKAAYPGANPRRLDRAGEEVARRVWRYDDDDGEGGGGNGDGAGAVATRRGAYREESVRARPGGFCAQNRFFAMDEMRADTNEGGRSNWRKMAVPAGYW